MKSADLPKEKASEPNEEARQPSVSIITINTIRFLDIFLHFTSVGIER